MKQTRKTQKQGKSTRSKARLVLDGEIYLEETKGKNAIAKHVIDGDLVLKLILRAIEEYLDTHQSDCIKACHKKTPLLARITAEDKEDLANVLERSACGMDRAAQIEAGAGEALSAKGPKLTSDPTDWTCSCGLLHRHSEHCIKCEDRAADYDDGRCAHGVATCDDCNAAWSLERRRLLARVAEMEVVLRSAEVLIVEIQEWMRESGTTLPREVDTAYLQLDAAVRQLTEIIK